MPREFLVLFIENMKDPFLTCTFESALILFIVGSAPPLGLHRKLDRPRMPFSARYLLLAHIKLKALELGLGKRGKEKQTLCRLCTIELHAALSKFIWHLTTGPYNIDI